MKLANFELRVKQRILREETGREFLIYEGPELDKIYNWLPDVQLAHTEFMTDKHQLG